MKLEAGLSSRYFKTTHIFHEEILGMVEDSIELNPNYSQEKKNRLIEILYQKFHHATIIEVKLARKNKTLVGG